VIKSQHYLSLEDAERQAGDQFAEFPVTYLLMNTASGQGIRYEVLRTRLHINEHDRPPHVHLQGPWVEQIAVIEREPSAYPLNEIGVAVGFAIFGWPGFSFERRPL
jgi:hypothetical protein